MAYLFIDTETTGTDSTKHSMIELCCNLVADDGTDISLFHNQMYDKKSANPVSLGALRVNGANVTDLYARPEEAPVVADLVKYLLSIKEKEIVIVGQNVQFDVGFLKALLRKYGIEDLEQIIGYKFIDTYSIAAALKRAGKLPEDTKLNLEGIAKALGIDTSKMTLHNAKADVDLTKQVYFKLIELLR